VKIIERVRSRRTSGVAVQPRRGAVTERAELPLRAVTGLYVITFLLVHATGVLAQEPSSTDPIEAMPIRFGPLGLSPTLKIANFGTDSNVFNEAVDPKSDFTMTVTPRVQARLRSGRLLLSGALASGLNYYQKSADERSVDYEADGRADVDLGRFRPYASASRIDTRERLNAELDLRAPRVQNSVAAGARVVATPRTGFVFDVRRSTVTFDEASVFNGVALSRTLNSATDVIEGGVELYLTPLTTFSVIASQQRDRFEQSPERDSDTFRVMPSVRFEAPAVIEGSFAIGYRRFDGVDPGLTDYAGVVFKGSLAHTFVERTRLELLLSRDVQYSFELAEDYYLTTGFRVSVTHQLPGAVEVRATGGREHLDYHLQDTLLDGVELDAVHEPRRDRAEIFGVGAGYRFPQNLRVGLDFEYVRRVSARVDRDYDRTRLLGSLTYGF